MADQTKFLADIRSSEADTRFAAWRSAGEQDPAVIAELAKVAAAAEAGVRKAALEALTTLTHSVGKQQGTPKRAEVSKQLTAVAAGSLSVPVRAHALRLLSLIGEDDAVAPVVKVLSNGDLREEAVFCLERIPGPVATKALVSAYSSAPTDFKPRLLAALGHRRSTEAVELARAAMNSSDKDLAIAGVRALGRIGAKPDGAVHFPAMTGWQAIDGFDSQLRYADAQAAAGNHAEAMRIYKAALDKPEEHWQCAGIVGMAKIGTSEAVAAIAPKLKSSDRVVRITAEKASKIGNRRP